MAEYEMTVSAIRQQTSAAATVDELVGEIVRHIEQGDWQPGDKLPTERMLEARFGVARNTLRKGLHALESRGLIVRRVGSGSFVATPGKPRQPANTAIAQALGASPSEVMEARLRIEPWAAALAARRASLGELRRITDCLQATEAAKDPKKFEYWDGQLHNAIIASAKNEMITAFQALIDTVRQQKEWMALKKRTSTPANKIAYKAQHREIVAALMDRDPDGAMHAMERHLLQVRHVMLGE